MDQTIIHATVDPTVAEWQQDVNNPNHPAVKDVRQFQLNEGPGSGQGCWYYIKLRPGLTQFLENVAKLYELHIYTMGTRAYAAHIATIVDPDRKIFGDRILSRDESGSLTAKNLQRLFPVDTKMVVIIDDRGDVWKWSDNLVKVTPYDFFIGIGDINSSFLPKKPELQTTSSASVAALRAPDEDLATGVTPNQDGPVNGENGNDVVSSTQTSSQMSTTSSVSTLDQLVSMGGGDDPTMLQEQASKQDETLTAQLQDRPLLQQQKRLDAEEEATATATATATSTAESSPDEPQSTDSPSADELPAEPAPHRHNLLQDNDTELQHLERSLTEVHRTFFEEYDAKLEHAHGGRLAVLRGETKRSSSRQSNAELEVVPDIKMIMPQMKLRVLEGVVLVLSGVVPLGADVLRYVCTISRFHPNHHDLCVVLANVE